MFNHKAEWQKAIEAMAALLKKGELVYDETVIDGFDNIPKALGMMLTGGNIGKAIVRVVKD